MGHCIVDPVWRHQLFFCRNNIGCRKKKFMSHSSSMFDHSIHKKWKAQKIIDLFHIASFQFLTDKGTADLSFSFHFFWNHIHRKAKLLSHLPEKFRISLAFISKPEIFSYSNVFCLKIPHQNLFNKSVCFHVADPGIQRAFDQNIHTCILKNPASFFFCKDHLASDSQGKENCLKSLFFLLQNSFHQFPVSTVYAVKFSKCYRTP